MELEVELKVVTPIILGGKRVNKNFMEIKDEKVLIYKVHQEFLDSLNSKDVMSWMLMGEIEKRALKEAKENGEVDILERKLDGIESGDFEYYQYSELKDISDLVKEALVRHLLSDRGFEKNVKEMKIIEGISVSGFEIKRKSAVLTEDGILAEAIPSGEILSGVIYLNFDLEEVYDFISTITDMLEEDRKDLVSWSLKIVQFDFLKNKKLMAVETIKRLAEATKTEPGDWNVQIGEKMKVNGSLPGKCKLAIVEF